MDSTQRPDAITPGRSFIRQEFEGRNRAVAGNKIAKRRRITPGLFPEERDGTGYGPARKVRRPIGGP